MGIISNLIIFFDLLFALLFFLVWRETEEKEQKTATGIIVVLFLANMISALMWHVR